MASFWNKLNKPFFLLAPLADVTDAAFRRVIAKYSRPGGPAAFFTEFVSADGLASPGREMLKKDLEFSAAERPVVAQLFGGTPAKMEEAARLCAGLGFDGIDINMGCPDRSVEKQGAGAAMMKDLARAEEIIEAARCGAPTLPVSVKTRLGYGKHEIEEWLGGLLGFDLAALTVHLRTRKEMSVVPAKWELMPDIVALARSIDPETLIIGNGDVRDLDDARAKAAESGADGVMLGRAIFGNPWLFADPPHAPTVEEKLSVMVEHTKLFEKKFSGVKSFAVMKKHYKAYVNGFDGAKELRAKLMDAQNAAEVEGIVKEFLGEAPKR